MWVANAVSPILVETPEAAQAADVINMDAQTAGSKSANFFAGFTSPALTVTSGAVKWAKANDGQTMTLVSSYACLDSEITARSGVGAIGLRYDPVAKTALVLTFGSAGTVSVGFAANIDPTSITSANPFNVHSSSQTNISLAPFGWTALNEGDLYTLGATGFDVYVKWNGTEVFRYKEYLKTSPGVAFAWAHPSYAGVGNTTVAYVPSPPTYSNRARNYFELRDFGLKASLTTGSISATSNQLTVADASGFSVGDKIIVEIGGEAGLGARGTVGVGGTWPALSYTTTTTMNADTGKANNTLAWVQATGDVYISSGGVWSQPNTFTYYTVKVLPRALQTTITGKSGNVLTLAATASVAATNANVHYDNAAAFLPMTDAGTSAYAVYGSTYKLPDGNFAVGSQLLAPARHGSTLKGNGPTRTKLFSPKGAFPLTIQFNQTTFPTVEDLAYEGNHRLGSDGYPQGFMHASEVLGPLVYTVSGLNCAGMVVRNTTATDVYSFAIAFNNSTNCLAHNCTLTNNAPIMSYNQWWFSDTGTDNTFINCSVPYSISLIKAFESFGGLRARFINCGGMNVLCSANSAGDWLYDGFYSDIYAGSFYFVNAGYPGEPIMNINANAYPGSPYVQMGGKIINPRIIQHAKINYLTGGSAPAIQIQPVISNVTITGQYAGASTPFSTTLGGYLEGPDWTSGDSTTGPIGVLFEGSNTQISGIRVVGKQSDVFPVRGGFYSTQNSSVSNVTNCIADTFILDASTTKSGNRTNAGASVP